MHITPHQTGTTPNADPGPSDARASYAFPGRPPHAAPPVPPTTPTDRVTLSAGAASRARSSLVAARVETPAFATPAPTTAADVPTPGPTPDTFPLYRHPADRNAAATAVFAGRTLDVTA